MTTELDLELLPETLNLVNELGKLVKITIASQQFDPEVNGVVQLDPKVYSLRVTPPFPTNKSLVEKEDGDMTTYLPAKDLKFEPKTGMEIEVDGESWQVVGKGKIYSGDLVCAWELQLRK